jgi:hypothetical protein
MTTNSATPWKTGVFLVLVNVDGSSLDIPMYVSIHPKGASLVRNSERATDFGSIDAALKTLPHINVHPDQGESQKLLTCQQCAYNRDMYDAYWTTVDKEEELSQYLYNVDVPGDYTGLILNIKQAITDLEMSLLKKEEVPAAVHILELHRLVGLLLIAYEVPSER